MKPVFTALFEGIESGAIYEDPRRASVMIVYNDGTFSIGSLLPVTFTSMRIYVNRVYSGRKKRNIKSFMIYLPDEPSGNSFYYNILAQF